MSFWDYFKTLKSPEHRLAWVVAVAADAVQIAAFPLFAEGGLSAADSLLDLIVAFVLIRLLGWHWAFLPTLAAELIPGVDMFPTWTAAVWFVTRQRVKQGEPEILPPRDRRRRRGGRTAISRQPSGDRFNYPNADRNNALVCVRARTSAHPCAGPDG